MARGQRRQRWRVGDVFLVRQQDGLWTVGQIVDAPMPNVPSCVLFANRQATPESFALIHLDPDQAIASVWSTRDALDSGEWKIVAHQPVSLPQSRWANEPLRFNGWIGAMTYGSDLIGMFLDAFYGLRPWDDMHDPRFFEEMVLPSSPSAPKRRLTRSGGE